MEQLIKIPTSNKKIIYGIFRGSLSQPLVVFVHGLGGIMNQHIYYNGARFLERNGISSFRFNLYGWEKDSRNLIECTVDTHSFDLDKIIEYFRKKRVKKIFVVGHSFGGPTILLSKNKDFDGIILWEPSYDEPKSFEEFEYVPALDLYKVRWGIDVLIGKKMFEAKGTLRDREERGIKEITVPIKIIVAGRGFLVRGGKRYYALANEPKAHVVVENADHLFDIDGVEEELFKETLSWIKKFS